MYPYNNCQANVSGSYPHGFPMGTEYSPINSMVSQPMYLANSPGIINTIIPFSGDTTNVQESIYEFLDQVRYSPTYKTVTTEEKKIEAAGVFLRDRAREWYQNQDWSEKKYGDEKEVGSFVHSFIKQFLSDVVLYNLRTTYNQRKQVMGEDALHYVKDKLKLHKRFSNVVPENESMVTADIVQGLTFESLKGLKSPPISINDLEGQLQQADWFKRQELKREVAIQLSGGNPQLAQFMIGPSMMKYTQKLPNNSLVNHTLPYGYSNYQQYPGTLTQPPDIDNINVMQLMCLQQQLKLQPAMLQPTLINNSSTTAIAKDEMYAALNAKLDKLSLDLENSKSMGKVNYHNSNSRNSNSTSAPSSSNQNKNDYSCRNCGETGHVQRYCKQACKSCGDTSHTIGGCRNNVTSNQDFHNGRRQ